MKKGEIIKNITVEKLVFGGKGFAKLKSENTDINGITIFITGGAIPGSIVDLRIIKKRKDYFETQIVEIIKKSPIEKKHEKNIYGECGGCKWVNIPYDEQLKIKQAQVKESFFNIDKIQKDIVFDEIEASPLIDGYRNKVEFSFGKFISEKYGIEEHFNVGFHKQGEFSKIQDFDGCILIDKIQNKIYKEIKDFSKTLGLPVYDQKVQKGFFRHILIRKGFFTEEIMVILSFNHDYLKNKPDLSDRIEKLEVFFIGLVKKYPIIKSSYFSYNNNKADIAIGDLKLINGKETIDEILHGIRFEISPKSFFQTNSHGAELLYSKVLELAKKEDLKNQKVLDLYGGTGTIGMIFSKSGAKEVVSVELVESSSKDGIANARKNNLENISFVCNKVENFLEDYISSGNKADLLIIDPPRAGMHPSALPNILKFGTKQIIYVSCNPSTLARDLQYILNNSDYKIERVIPVDMFPHTHHIETIVSLIKQ